MQGAHHVRHLIWPTPPNERRANQSYGGYSTPPEMLCTTLRPKGCARSRNIDPNAYPRGGLNLGPLVQEFVNFRSFKTDDKVVRHEVYNGGRLRNLCSTAVVSRPIYVYDLVTFRAWIEEIQPSYASCFGLRLFVSVQSEMLCNSSATVSLCDKPILLSVLLD